MPYIVTWTFEDGAEEQSFVDKDDAQRHADSRRLGYLRDSAWCAVSIVDEAGSEIYSSVTSGGPAPSGPYEEIVLFG
jgi:hypothetical protein